MLKNNNWTVTIVRDRNTEDAWIATAKRDDFEFSQKVQSNEGEITEFCKTARAMYSQHVKDKSRSVELAQHFDEILEREDQREADEYAAKVKAAKDAADLAAKEAKEAAKAQQEATNKAAHAGSNLKADAKSADKTARGGKHK